MDCIQIATCRRTHGIGSTSVVNHSSTAILEPCHQLPWDMTGSIHIKKDHAHFFLAPLLDRLYRQDRSTAYRSTNLRTFGPTSHLTLKG